MSKVKETIKNIAVKAQTKAMMSLAGVRGEREDGDHLLEVLGVIIIAVVILIFFRGSLINMFNNGMSQTNQKVTDLFTNM